MIRLFKQYFELEFVESLIRDTGSYSSIFEYNLGTYKIGKLCITVWFTIYKFCFQFF